MPESSKVMFQAVGLSKHFGKLMAVDGLSFNVVSGEIFGIAGPNGSGKTTLFNIITHVPFGPSAGQMTLDGKNFEKMKAHRICGLGIARTFQIPIVIDKLSVLKNVSVGAIFGGHTRDPQKESMEALSFVGLLEKKESLAGTLRLFERKLVMLASALAMKPKLLLLDEPLSGLSGTESEQSLTLVKRINADGITVMMIEHKIDALMSISKRIMILDYGKKISEGVPLDVVRDERVLEAYLGERTRTPMGEKIHA